MPFEDGVFLNVSGATSAAAGQTIQSVVWNNIHADYSGAFNIVANQLAGTPTFKNIAWMNGGQEVWQRGTPIAVTAATTPYTADRWYILTNANQTSTVSRQTGLSNNSQFCARVQRDSGQTGIVAMGYGYPLDTDECQRLRGKFAYVSLRVRAGANWSPASGTLTLYLSCGTGASPAKAAGMSGVTQPILQAITLTTNTQLVQAVSTVVVPITTTQAEIGFTWTPVGTAGADDYFEIDDVELVAVPAADTDDYIPDDFEYLPFPTMLKGCMTHFTKTYRYSVAPSIGSLDFVTPLYALSHAAERVGLFWVYPVELRSSANPEATIHGIGTATSSAWLGLNVSASYAAIVSASVGHKGFAVRSASVSAAGNWYAIHAIVSAGI